MWLFHTNYYARYSARQQWWVSASYLCGHSDRQDWAVRLPGTIITVKEALVWLTPSQVRKAKQKGKRVERQGDIYFVPLAISDNDFDVLQQSRHQPVYVPHHPKGPSIVITHPQHPDVRLDWNQTWRAIQQKQMISNGRRAGAD